MLVPSASLRIPDPYLHFESPDTFFLLGNQELLITLLQNWLSHVGLLKKQESFRKTSTSVLLTMPKPLTVWIIINCGKFLKKWKYLTCLLRNLYAGQEATIRTGQETTDWFQIGNRVHQGCILSPCLFNLYAEYIMRNAGLDEKQSGIKIAGRNINNIKKYQ